MVWEIENEIRALVPMVYYHVWDNFPAPHYNGRYYRSTDEILCISKVTHEIVKEVVPEVSSRYLPHAVPSSVFFKRTSSEDKRKIQEVRNRMLAAASEENLNPKKKISILGWYDKGTDFSPIIIPGVDGAFRRFEVSDEVRLFVPVLFLPGQLANGGTG